VSPRPSVIFERSPSTVIWTFGVDVVPGSFGSCVPWVGPAVGSGAFGATGVTDRPLPDAGFEELLDVPRRCAVARRRSCLVATTGWLLSGWAARKRCIARSTSTEVRNSGGMLSVGRSLPLLMRGATRSAAVVPAGAFELPGDARMRDQLAALTARDDDRSPLAAMVASSTADLLSVVDTVGPVLASGAAGDELEGEQLSDRLAAVATMIEADLPTRVYAVDLGNFDTHANQAATHEALLGELDGALHDFVTRVADRHFILEKGRVVWSGTSGELSASPQTQHRYLGV